MSGRDPSTDRLDVDLKGIGDYYTQLPRNLLATYLDAQRRGDDLYYAAPAQILDSCIQNL